MSEIGYYRYKVSDLTVGERTISFYKNGALSGQKTVIIKEWCENQRIIKYLDSKGQYRFYIFNTYWEQRDKPKELGRSNKIITSILSDQCSFEILGKSNERTIKLIADEVTQTELNILSDLWLSPKVFLYIGSDEDENKDWLEVSISTKDTVSRLSKGSKTKITIDVELPEYYTLRML